MLGHQHLQIYKDASPQAVRRAVLKGLTIYDERLVYQTYAEPTDSRLWLWSDIHSLGRSSHYKIEIATFEARFGGPEKQLWLERGAK